MIVGYTGLAFADIGSSVSLIKYDADVTWLAVTGVVRISDDEAYTLRINSSGDMAVTEAGVRNHSGIFHSPTGRGYRGEVITFSGYAVGEGPA